MDMSSKLTSHAAIEDCHKAIAAYASKHGHSLHLPKGAPVHFNGDSARDVYCIQRGALRLSRLLADGRRQILSFAFPGEIIGLAHDGHHHTDCDVLSDASLSVLPISRVAAMAQTEPALMTAMLRMAAQEMHDMHGHLVLLGQKSAIERLASFLTVLGTRAGIAAEHRVCFDLPMSRADIGDYLGMSVETVSRSMTRLRAAGLVYLPRPDRVCLKDLDALSDFAEGEMPDPARYAA